MANISAYLQKAYLDWCLGGASATQPSNRFVGLCNGTPTSITGSEIGAATLAASSRQTSLFGAAASPAGSASNTAAMSFSFASGASVLGLIVADSVSVLAGNLLWYGTLQTARTPLAGDTLVVQAGALTITLS